MTMKFKNLVFILIVATLGGVVALIGNSFLKKENQSTIKIVNQEKPIDTFSHYAKYSSANNLIDFTNAAEKAVHGVVHIKTSYANPHGGSLYDYLFREHYGSMSLGVGSGVIISPDGFIVTNNHVIEKSNKVDVVLNDKRTFEAKLIGKDASTDLALLKIDAKDLDYIIFGNSDKVKIGEWVLAVGNPFNLTSTVTAGIISAKGRNINIMEGQYPIESFLQTDAAVNPGNSGGALVNLKAELVGVNAAIATKTGSYSGYSFAIPSSIVKKVVADLKEYGVVQRGLLGVSILDMTSEIAKSLDLEKIQGVLVEGLLQGGAAAKAGIKPNDVIIKVQGREVNTVAELQEQVSKYRPGDKVDVVVLRDKKEKTIVVVLQNKRGDTDIISSDIYSVLGGELQALSDKERNKYGLTGGVKVLNLKTGKLQKAGVRDGYIITHVNRTSVKTVEDIEEVLNSANGGIYLKGIYPSGLVEYYAFGMD